MYGLGEDTAAIINLGIPHPIEHRHQLPDSDREHRIRRDGTLSRWAGALLLTADALAVLTLMLLAHPNVWGDPNTRHLVTLLILLAGFTGTALLTSGLVERQLRQTRTLIRRATARADANADLGDANRQAIETNSRLVAEAIVTLSGIEKRLNALEHAIEAVPDYGKGVIDGATMRANALGGDNR